MPPQRHALTEQFLESARALGRAMWAGKERCFREFKLHPAQVRILYFVKHHGPVTVKDMAQVMGTTSSAATQLIDGVVRAGYLERVEDSRDRRKVQIQLSAKGRAKFAKFRKDHLAWVAKLLSPLTDRELEQLIAIQKKVMAQVAPIPSNSPSPRHGSGQAGRGRAAPTTPSGHSTGHSSSGHRLKRGPARGGDRRGIL
ncbi:MAG: MarR family transcriptional regulator [Candidatus Kerfeldbacteria bacterium]|nr:MarR family transcriptional regulator [Candidatus Kerfeldbacteria bacterium]